MNYYFAPMEGITGYIYRNAVWRHFPYVDKFYAPFIQPNPKRVFVPKEERDILPEHNVGIPLVPQVLTCSADGFIRAGKALEAYGYTEVNLNLGCPSGTVVSKGKGAGMLADQDRLRAFFDEVFSVDWNAEITVKTRLGVTEEDDFQELMKVFLQFPIAELIIHPRYRMDYYKGMPRLEAFQQALQINCAGEVYRKPSDNNASMKICYNGNIFTKKDYDRLLAECGDKNLAGVMLGRGLLANPALVRELKGGTSLTMEELKAFHDDIFASYQALDFGEKNILFKMKELWNYWGTIVTGVQKELKRVRKANRFADYRTAVEAVFSEGQFTDTYGYLPKE